MPWEVQLGASTRQAAHPMLASSMGSSRTILQRLGPAIRARREQLELTQESAAARSDLSVRFWRDLEASKPATVGLDVIERLIEGLNWS